MKPSGGACPTRALLFETLDDIRYPIPPETIESGRKLAAMLAPKKRTAGFADEGERGSGDFLDYIGSSALFFYFAEAGRIVTQNITVGRGDLYDIGISVQGNWRQLNVKTSKFSPVRSFLNLMVKKEECDRLLDGYVQIFVHLEEPEDPEPHVHIVGYANRTMLNEIPMGTLKGNGHPGKMIALTNLKPMSELLGRADRVP